MSKVLMNGANPRRLADKNWMKSFGLDLNIFIYNTINIVIGNIY